MPLTLGFEEVPHVSLVKENKITMMFESKKQKKYPEKYNLCPSLKASKYSHG